MITRLSFNRNGPPANVCIQLHSYDFSPPVTLTLTRYEVDLEILKTYLRTDTKNEVLGKGFQKSEHKHGRQTDRQMRPNALPRRIRG